LSRAGFTSSSRVLQIAPMNLSSSTIWTIVGLIALGLVVTVLVPYLSKEARIERRRRKNNSPVVSKVSRPMVKFSVNTPEETEKK
jgi:hypothetical protein